MCFGKIGIGHAESGKNIIGVFSRTSISIEPKYNKLHINTIVP